MAEFNRIPDNKNIFEGMTDEVVEITLKVIEEFDNRYNKNPENKLKAVQVRELLTSENRICYFQKQKADEKTNRSRHKIIVPIGNERAIEFIVSLQTDKIDTFTELYSYRVYKSKDTSFFNEPTRNTTKRNCHFKLSEIDKKSGSGESNFKELYKTVESSEIPQLDINKEKDKQIWGKYVTALKSLVKQKEQVWKIQDIKIPYSEKRDGEIERSTYIDIFINEKDIIEQFERDIISLFPENELEDYGVSETKAFIEFKNFRELGFQELSQLKEVGEELFYEISSSSPIHSISGKIEFTYTDITSKEDVFNELLDRLQNDYQLESTINQSGYINLLEKEIPHLQKIISDNYSHLLSIYKDNVVQLKVELHDEDKLQTIQQALIKELKELGHPISNVNISDESKNIILEIAAPLFERNGILSIFKQKGLPMANLSVTDIKITKSILRFSANRKFIPKQINGFEYENEVYQIVNPTKEQIQSAQVILENEFKEIRFRKMPTLYFLKQIGRENTEILRNFKTKTDLNNKSEFILADSILKISAENNEDFKVQIQRIKQLFPNAIIEEKQFNPTFKIQFDTDIESKREALINRIQNDIRKEIGKLIEFDTIKNNTKVLFTYQFNSDNERENFRKVINSVCLNHRHILNYSFENVLGRTTYELFKNQTLELEKEKEIKKSVNQARFIFLTPEQRQNLGKQIELYGEDAYFKDGIEIGRLIIKDHNKLKFKITDAFDTIISGKEDDRIELDEMRHGFIKPIFPGELTNIVRMIRAMKKVTEPNNKNGYPVNQNLPNFLFDPNEARQSYVDIDAEKLKVVANLNEPLLQHQPKQLEAVVKTITAKDLSIIQGPPGTGKTTVIAEIIWQTLLSNPQSKILVTSQTNLAVDNALERLKGKKMVRPIRVGKIDKFEDEGKIYSNERIKNWIQAKSGSDEEINNSDNAVCEWIENIKNNCSQDEKYLNIVTKWKIGLDKKESQMKSIFSNAYYQYVNVFAATCSECGSGNFGLTYKSTFFRNSESKAEPEFDLVIMDEASKSTPPELILPLTLGKKVVIIGDHKQLPPMIDEKEFGEALEFVGAKNLIEDWTKEDYKISQFEKLFKNAPKSCVTSLDTQFRMHEQIMDCISEFYSDQEELENGLICGIKREMDIPDFNIKASRWHGIKMTPFIEEKNHAIWVNVETPEEKVGTSYKNNGEIEAIQLVLNSLTKADGFNDYLAYFKKDEDKEIGIITYYMPQMLSIRNALYPNLSKTEWRNFENYKFENEFQIPLRINTVDRFQGMERNIIIVSTVRSNKQYNEEKGKKSIVDNEKYPFALGFARELQRINVGFSRAKRLLIVIGNEKHFSHKPEYQQAIQKMHRIDIVQIQNLTK